MTEEQSFFVFCKEDIDTSFVYVSPSVKRVLGYEPSELLESSLAKYCHPEELALGRLISAYILKKDCLVQGSSFHILHKNGEFKLVEAYTSSCYNLRIIVLNLIEPDQVGHTRRSATVDKWFTFKTDGGVTARNLSPSNHALLTRLEQELSNGGSLQLTPQPRVIFALRNASDPHIMYVSCLSNTLLGIDGDELIGAKFSSYIHPNQKDYVIDKINQVRNEVFITRMAFLFQSTYEWKKLSAICWGCSDGILLMVRNYRPGNNSTRPVLDSDSSESDPGLMGLQP